MPESPEKAGARGSNGLLEDHGRDTHQIMPSDAMQIPARRRVRRRVTIALDARCRSHPIESVIGS